MSKIEELKGMGWTMEDIGELYREINDVYNMAREALDGQSSKPEKVMSVNPNDSLEKKVSNVLSAVGCSYGLTGYKYLTIGVMHRMEHGNVSMTKELYPYIAGKMGTTPGRVERAIRHCIGDAFRRPTDQLPDIVKQIWPFVQARKSWHPTNSEFIAGVSEYLRLH